MKKLLSGAMALAMLAASPSAVAGVQSDSGVGTAVTANAFAWNGMGWNGMGWNGVGWNGITWNGNAWNGNAWNGLQPSGSAPPNPLRDLGLKPLLVLN